jgi:transcriptional regulator with XRE-family HTH domain
VLRRRQMGQLSELGWGAKRIARELGLARNTVRRYLRGAPAEVQEPPAARRLDETARAEALRLYDGEAEGDAVVVTRLLSRQTSGGPRGCFRVVLKGRGSNCRDDCRPARRPLSRAMRYALRMGSAPSDDYYALLGIDADVDGAKLRRVWRRLALRWHRTAPVPTLRSRSRRSRRPTRCCSTLSRERRMIGGAARG